jgi:recombination protein RecT
MAQEKDLTVTQKALSIFEMLEKNKDKIQATLPNYITPDKVINLVMNSIRRTPLIANCTKESVFNCIMTCSQLGLVPDDIRGMAYIIPFFNNINFINI